VRNPRNSYTVFGAALYVRLAYGAAV